MKNSIRGECGGGGGGRGLKNKPKGQSFYRGAGGMFPYKIVKSRGLEMQNFA